MHLAASGLKTHVSCCLPFSMMDDGSSVGLILDCSIRQICDNGMTAIYLCRAHCRTYVDYICTYLRYIIPWTCSIANYNIFNPFEIIRQCFFIGNISRVKFHEWLLIHKICRSFLPRKTRYAIIAPW